MIVQYLIKFSNLFKSEIRDITSCFSRNLVPNLSTSNLIKQFVRYFDFHLLIILSKSISINIIILNINLFYHSCLFSYKTVKFNEL